MAVFPSSLKFNGTYRPYQKRILEKVPLLLSQKKLHLVAAPGSGKTTLGIELILQVNEPCIILTPSITIREQWIQRFIQDFVHDESYESYISRDLKIPAPIICITYQSLYSAYQKKVDQEDEIHVEDYSLFNLDEKIKEYQIKTICLDECHHLKNEWWRVLESVIKKIDDPFIISLTATPPYDATPTEWKRYIHLCGPIDEEIFIPELVKDHNLCFHQDYIYCNLPTLDEQEQIQKFYQNAAKTFEKYQHHATLIELLLKLNIHQKYANFRKKYYQNASFYRCVILFLYHNHQKINFFIRFSCDIEPFQMQHLEILLQTILFDETFPFKEDDFLIRLKKELIALRLIHHHQVHLTQDDRHEKLLIESKNKLHSIVEITQFEYTHLKQDLRMLILADYIKKETKSSINNLKKEMTSIGILPIFETLRRQEINDLNLCLLSGSLILIPLSCVEPLKEECVSNELFTYKKVNQTSYCELYVLPIHKKIIIQALTRLFEKGYFQVVIGTKALLGEGWDAPCVNTLLLASFQGSYVSSNQTRGRAIRINEHYPQKISNIWHLLTINPYNLENNPDLDLLKKRFESFIGIGKDQCLIENGIARILTPIPQNEKQIQESNQNMLNLAANRNHVAKQWQNSLNQAEEINQIKNELIFDKQFFKHSYSFYNTIIQMILTLFLFFNIYEMFDLFHFNRFIPLLLYMISLIVLGSYFVFLILRILRLKSKKSKMYYIAEALCFSLKDIGILTSPSIEIKIEENKNSLICYLKNASTYEQNIFAESFLQLYAYPDSPRYLLCRPKGIFQKEFYVVPDLFKKNRKVALVFAKRMNQNFGYHKLYFTKSNAAQSIVLHTRILYLLNYKNLKISTKRSIYTKK